MSFIIKGLLLIVLFGYITGCTGAGSTYREIKIDNVERVEIRINDEILIDYNKEVTPNTDLDIPLI